MRTRLTLVVLLAVLSAGCTADVLGRMKGFDVTRYLSGKEARRYDTFIHTQAFGSRTWELSLPNGSYSVHIVAGDPGFFDRDLERYQRVTPGSMQSAAHRMLRRDARVALSVVPRGRTELALDGSEPVSVS